MNLRHNLFSQSKNELKQQAAERSYQQFLDTGKVKLSIAPSSSSSFSLLPKSITPIIRASSSITSDPLPSFKHTPVDFNSSPKQFSSLSPQSKLSESQREDLHAGVVSTGITVCKIIMDKRMDKHKMMEKITPIDYEKSSEYKQVSIREAFAPTLYGISPAIALPCARAAERYEKIYSSQAHKCVTEFSTSFDDHPVLNVPENSIISRIGKVVINQESIENSIKFEKECHRHLTNTRNRF